MYDGGKIEQPIEDFDKWKIDTGMGERLNTGYNETNGQRKERTRGNTTTVYHNGTWEGYNIEVKEVNTTGRKNRYYLHIDGSFHKNHFNGANYLPFPFSELIKQLHHIETGLQLTPKNAMLKNLEFGINIKTLFPPFQFLRDNLLLHKGKPFVTYDKGKDGKVLGMRCTHEEMEIKIYDKGLQYDLPYNLMRFELRIIKMNWFKKYGIKCLNDLHELDNAKPLLLSLLEVWDSLLFTDLSINGANLTAKENELFLSGSRAGFWPRLKETVNLKTYYKKLNQFENIVTAKGRNLPLTVRPQIETEWQRLCNGYGTDYPHGQTVGYGTDSLCGQQVKNSGVWYGLSIKVKGESIPPPEMVLTAITGNRTKSDTLLRFCATCKNDISNQPDNSIFCSPKYVGEVAAHKCRNGNSNPRNNYKKKVEKMMMKGLLFPLDTFLINPFKI